MKGIEDMSLSYFSDTFILAYQKFRGLRQKESRLHQDRENRQTCLFWTLIYIYVCYMYIYILLYVPYTYYIYIWVNYNISPTWIKAIWGWFPLLTMIPVRSQWGRYKLPRSVAMAGSISKGLRNLGWEIRGCSDWETPECPTVWKHLRKSHSDRLFLAQAMGNPKDGNSSIHRSGNK